MSLRIYQLFLGLQISGDCLLFFSFWLLHVTDGRIICAAITAETTTQFSSVTQSCPALCNPMDCSTPGLPVHQQLPEFTQTHVHWVSDAIQPSHPLLSPSPPAPQSFPASEYFQMSQFFASGGQSISFSFSISPSSEHSGLISSRMD